MGSPKTWGRHFWITLHITALGFPEAPTKEDAAKYKEFYESFGRILPCKKCATNYQRHLQDIPLTAERLESRAALFAWTVDLHNSVNKETGKLYWNKDYAHAFYISGKYNECNTDINIQVVWKIVIIAMIILNLIVLAVALQRLLHP